MYVILWKFYFGSDYCPIQITEILDEESKIGLLNWRNRYFLKGSMALDVNDDDLNVEEVGFINCMNELNRLKKWGAFLNEVPPK
ncbi:hypothetical protein [Oceanobacillus rekensis]|uniref:hypothetical protein n=1 Tax=Oceanobacillus rekensis TaxID=937927 RepID=UPI000B4484C6|nr:hypothetical protein [Oceanobacillus rekensis]